MAERAPLERERRFLVEGTRLAAALARCAPDRVEELHQGYLSLDPERVVRVRTSRPLPPEAFLDCLEHGRVPAVSTGPPRAWLGIKGLGRIEGEAMVRPEWELPLDGITAEQLLAGIAHRPVIHKLRAELPAGDTGLVWQLDLFLGANLGLRVAELELPAGAGLPESPDWLGPEITGQTEYSNLALVGRPFAGPR